jgi:hypothetical protein
VDPDEDVVEDDDEQAAASAETSTTPARPVPICLTRVPNPFFLRFIGSSLTLGWSGWR